MTLFKKVFIIAAAATAFSANVFAAPTPHEKNRQIERGTGFEMKKMVDFSTVSGAIATPHTIIRHTRLASERKALREDVSSSNVVKASKMVACAKTASQRTRNS